MLQKTPLLYGFLNLLPSELSPGWIGIIIWNSGYFFQFIHSSVLMLTHTQYICHVRNTPCHSTWRRQNSIVLITKFSDRLVSCPVSSIFWNFVANLNESIMYEASVITKPTRRTMKRTWFFCPIQFPNAGQW